MSKKTQLIKIFISGVLLLVFCTTQSYALNWHTVEDTTQKVISKITIFQIVISENLGFKA